MQTGEFPVLIHFSHHESKADRENMWRKAWWTMRIPFYRDIVNQRLAAGKIRFAHDKNLIMTWNEFCPPTMIGLSWSVHVTTLILLTRLAVILHSDLNLSRFKAGKWEEGTSYE